MNATSLPVIPEAPVILEAPVTLEALAPARLDSFETPAVPGALAPRWGSGPAGLHLTWLEPRSENGEGAVGVAGAAGGTKAVSGHRWRLARWVGEGEGAGNGGWAESTTLVEGDSFFANWADTPSVIGREGVYWGQWLEKLDEATYAYGVSLLSSHDGDRWTRRGLLHDDTSPTEHGFVSWVDEGDAIRAFWLDGRAMLATDDSGGQHGHGPMQLRTARLPLSGPPLSGPPTSGPSTSSTVEGPEASGGSDSPGEAPDSSPVASQQLDGRVCECCPTDAALAADGPVVVYRDRSEEEIRDIAIVRRTARGWSEPRRVHADGWKILGCPVNGPAVAARGERVAVAWFTAADARPRVQLAWSNDGGESFGEPILVDGAEPAGRVDLVLAPSGDAVVTWLGQGGGTRAGGGAGIGGRAKSLEAESLPPGRVLARRISPDGEAGPARLLGETSTRRKAGVPRAIVHGGRLWVAFVVDREPAEILVAAVPLDSI